MPYIWAPPDAAVTHNGKTVYHAYDEDGYEMLYIYTSDIACCDEGQLYQYGFDIRELAFPEGLNVEDPDDHVAILRHAIETDQIPFEETKATYPAPARQRGE